jgi:hypothetical protein
LALIYGRKRLSMSLLRNPLKALDQIDWYVEHENLEQFPDSFVLAAGNLCRQTVEQILFILAFYSGMPRNKYLKPNGELREIKTILDALGAIDPITKKSYWKLARCKGPRIQKFAKNPRTLNMWRRQFNEPSHFGNPAKNRKIRRNHIMNFSRRVRMILDEKDVNLIICSVNEIRSNGKFKAFLTKDSDNVPGVSQEITLKHSDIKVAPDGNFTMQTAIDHIIINKSKNVINKWTKKMVFLERSGGIKLSFQFVNKHGDPININSLEEVLACLSRTESDRKALKRHLSKYGLKMSWEEDSSAQIVRISIKNNITKP